MNQRNYWLCFASIFSNLCLTVNQPLVAQIVPDATLPNNSIIIKEENTLRIEGGSSAGSNLFHSFGEFSIPTGGEAFFNNSENIQNIFSRITGNNISNIDGLIRANGSANLFLINPNGIMFGTNAKLNIGGSFIGTTADTLQFSDGNFFSAAQPNTPPILAISVPVGLQWNENNSGAIALIGSGHSLTIQNDLIKLPTSSDGNLAGLHLQPGRTLALVGNNVNLKGAILTSENGSIEIGSVSRGTVSLAPDPVGWKLDYSQVDAFGDISFSRAALAYISSDRGSGMQLAGRSLQMSSGSIALIESRGMPGGEIRVRASERIELIGTDESALIPSGIVTQIVTVGTGADIVVSTRRLTMRDGGELSTISRSDSMETRGGNIIVEASELVEAIATSPKNAFTFSGILSAGYNHAKPGDLTVSTDRLSLRDGGLVVSTTYGSAKNGGNLNINATESVETLGVNYRTRERLPTRSFLGTVATASGNGGNMRIDTARIRIRDGGAIRTSSEGSGNAGNAVVNATESIEVSGVATGTAINSRLTSAVEANNPFQIIQERPLPTGNAGSIDINTARLLVSDGAVVSVANEGSGNAGDMQIVADEIVVDRQGSIAGSNRSGNGGNINLEVASSLQLRNRSQISTTAGGSGNGGNITINANTLVALENSDIIANAQQGAGGRVSITTGGLFGTEFRDRLTPLSDVTATSDLGFQFDGTVEINTPDVDPSSGLVELPLSFNDITSRIATVCEGARENRFVVTGSGGSPGTPYDALGGRYNAVRVTNIGRGGLPPDPNQTLPGRATWRDLRALSDRTSRGASLSQHTARGSLQGSKEDFTLSSHSPIIEATGWEINQNGQVELVVNEKSSIATSPWNRSSSCGV